MVRTGAAVKRSAGGVTRARRVRAEGLDRLRGLAVLLMVVDHVLLVTGEGEWIRTTITRASLPLFCVVGGSLAAERLPRYSRVLEVLVVGLVIGPFAAVAGLPPLDVLVVIAWSLGVYRFTEKLGLRWVVVCWAVLQPVTWPGGHGGYEFGTVLALVYVGAWIGTEALDNAGQRVPRSLAVVGRRPLTIYASHVVALAFLTA